MLLMFITLALIFGGWQAALAQPSFYAFESGQVRPLALSPDGSQLYAVNTPDNRLEVFSVGPDGLHTHLGAVPVGMEPVAVAAPNPTEVWVVNHLSDSVSIVDVSRRPFRVVRTLWVGDEPNDIVFAGADRQRAFITAAHRGQNSPHPQGHFDQPGMGRADVYVFDVATAKNTPDVAPDAVVTLFGDKPRALAVSPDGQQVYVAVFRSGNQTTALSEGVVCNGGAQALPCTVAGVTYPGGLPAPNVNHEGARGPETGLIVKYNGSQWIDELGRDWSNGVRFTLPDLDVFTLDATTLATVNRASGVGTILFNMAVNPQTGTLYVSNTEARNEIRFEGPGILAGDAKPDNVPATVRGRLHEARITVIDGTNVQPRHLNKHIPYGASPMPDGVRERSLATPLGMAVSRDGATLYVAAFGSSKIGVFNTATLADDSFVPDAASHISVGGGPTGLLLDETHNRLYVLTRFDNAVTSIDLSTHAELERWPLPNPEPASLVDGRPFLYDAVRTSSNGEASCSSCHIFGDMDDLAWDLGDPDGDVLPNPNPFITGDRLPFHPLKGPMTTQSLRGLANHGPMHWRGDRTGGHDDPPGDPLDEAAAFRAFNGAFDGLLGRDEGELTDAEMQAFTDFVLQITYPPNPIRQLDNTLRPDEAEGRRFFFLDPGPDLEATCEGCHRLDPMSGFFGSGGESTTEGEPQEFKVAHLRNLYQKVGLFGMPDTPFFPGDPTMFGDQVRGFGFLHDGSVDTIPRFLSAVVFQIGFRLFPQLYPDPDLARRQLAAYLMAFDTNLAPLVGQQVTLTVENTATATRRIALMEARADTSFPMAGAPLAMECEIIVKGVVNDETRGWMRLPSGMYRSDRASEPELSSAALQALAAVDGQALTYTCVPPGAGLRMGVDRDADGEFDQDEADAMNE